MKHLVEEYQEFIKDTGYENISADDLVCELINSETTNLEHVEYLNDFIIRWELTEGQHTLERHA